MIINGVAVVTAPADIDATTAEELRMALLEAGRRGHATVVVDMTRTWFCDSAGLSVLIQAHRRALAEYGGLRLVLPAEGPAARVLTVTGLDRLIPSCATLGQAVALVPAAPVPPSPPRPSPGLAPPGPDAQTGGELVAEAMLQASVQAGDSGPVIVLAGEADLSCAEQLDALITGQLAGGTRQLTIDVSGLRFADSASIRTLVLAARTLTERGGRLVLLDPQPAVARVLALLGADQMITIQATTPVLGQAQPGPQGGPAGTAELARTRT